MKKYILFIACLFTTIAYSQNVKLLGSLNPYPNLVYTDVWGYAAEGREYAFIGTRGGTSIIDVTNPANPVEVAFINGPFAAPYEWRDFKTHLNYLYVTSEGSTGGAGLQIIDLSQLPDTAFLVNTFNSTFTRAHNLYIDSGYAYVIGTSSGGMHILDLTDPVNPVQVGYYGASGYIHDVYVWNDTAYASSENTYDLIDLSDKSNPQLISQSAALPNIYAHSGWLTEDKRYFIACEEFNQRDLMVWDLQNRNSWDLVFPSYNNASGGPIHNVFVKGNYAHISYYIDGYVVFDITDPTNPTIAGQYDTYPFSGNYAGAWGVYPYLPSGNVLISDMATGLYIVDFLPDNTTSVNDANDEIPITYELEQNFPNPFNPITTISFRTAEDGFVELSIFNSLGENVQTLIKEYLTAGSYQKQFDGSELPSGIYFAKLSSDKFISTIKMLLLK